MSDLSDLGKQQREELIDDIAEKMSDTCDMGVSFSQYASAVVDMLEKSGKVKFQSKNCPQCGRDRFEAERGFCQMGGCPCGGDL